MLHLILQQIEPYAVGNVTRLNGHSESKSSAGGNLSVLNENTAKATLGRLSVSQNSDPLVKETKSLGRLSVSQNSDPAKEAKVLSCMLRSFYVSSLVVILDFKVVLFLFLPFLI